MEQPNRLTTRDVCRISGYSNVHLWRLEQRGQFPKRIKTGPDMRSPVYWNLADVKRWHDEREKVVAE